MHPKISEAEISGLPWSPVKKGMQTLREARIREWIFHRRPVYPNQESPDDNMPFTTALRSKFMTGSRST